jgi:hypothetical protein
MKPNQPSEPQSRPPAPPDASDIDTVQPAPADEAPTLPAPTLAQSGGGGGSRRLPELFGRYRIVKLLGEGGMGAVYLAHDSQLDRPVALKVPTFSGDDAPRMLERFYREARAAAGIQHPNICPVHDFGAIDGVHYLTMAFIEGKSLAELLREARKPMGMRQAAALARKLALALEEAHRRQVIHRDLKPSNVMVTRRGEPVVMDFGLARRGKAADSGLTQSGGVMGTPSYMAPEQARGDVEAMGPPCDIYGLGVMLYEMVAGRLPFVGADAMAVMAQVLMDQPRPPSAHRPDLDAQLEAVCLKAMAKRPEDRYRSMAELAAALGEYLKRATPATLPGRGADDPGELRVDVPGAEGRPPRGRSWRWLWAAVAAVVLLVGGGAVYFALTRPGGGASPSAGPEAEKPPTPAPPAGDEVAYQWLMQRLSGGGGVPDGPATEDTAMRWDPDDLRMGKIRAPDLKGVKPWLHDDFSDPKSGFPRRAPEDTERDYKDGKYVIKPVATRVLFAGVPLGKAGSAARGDFACEVTARVSGPLSAWIVGVGERPGFDAMRFRVLMLNGGRLALKAVAAEGSDPLDLLDEAAKTHPAINRGGQTRNTLLVVVRGRQLELYVNGVAVADPVLLSQTLPTPFVALGAHAGARGGEATFDSVTVWPADSIPPLEKRGAAPRGK